MLEVLKERVLKANRELLASGVVIMTWGNVSEIDDTRHYVVIKPSGIDLAKANADDMVVVDIGSGDVVDGKLKPSTDTDTHLEIYRNFGNIKAVVHTHSVFAVAFAQAGMAIPALGTTHADTFYGEIPCTREMTKEEVLNNYELNTGKVIVETIKNGKSDVVDVPAVNVKNHGPFVWGKDAIDVVNKAIILEKVAEMAFKTLSLNSNADMPRYLLDKHFLRKHGKSAYYGQRGGKI